MKMVDGDNARERGVMVAMGHGLCVSFCVCGEDMKNEVGPVTANIGCAIDLILHDEQPCRIMAATRQKPVLTVGPFLA
jgi:hypothetical protein